METDLPRALRIVLRLHVALLGAVFLAAALFVAVVMPYRSWDSLAFGAWSRQIAAGQHVFSNVIATNLNRPLFYLGQGYAWRWFGYHEWIGRSLSVAFAVAFVVGVWLVARRLGKRDDLFAAIAVAVALASSVFATYVAAGMTDVPVAATSVLAAASLWSRVPEWIRLPLVGVAAAAAGILPNLKQAGALWPVIIGGSAGIAAMLALKHLGSKTVGKAGLIALIAADLLIDGIVLGLAFLSGEKAGLMLTIALTIEVLFLGLSFAAELGQANVGRVAALGWTLALALCCRPV